MIAPGPSGSREGATSSRLSPAGMGAAWWLVALLFLAGIFSIIDRAILNVVVDPVRQGLNIDDEQIGLLQGLAFGIFYAVMGLPMGMLADRKSRKKLVIFGITLWSAATIWSGFAHSFGELFAARLLVGLGEAALGPCAISWIADMFPPEKRGRPISIYVMGQGLAGGISLSVTGGILTFAMAGGFDGFPVLSGLDPWRTAFVICGALGLLLSILLFTTHEPRDTRAAPPPTDVEASLPGAAEWGYLRRNAGVLVPLYFGFATCFMVAYGAGAWEAAMLMRKFDVPPSFLGVWLGPLTIAFAIVGPLLGGFFVDWSIRRRKMLARFAFLALVPLIGIPGTLSVMAPTPETAAILIASKSAVFAVLGTVMLATLQAIVPPAMRGIAISMTLILNTLIGAALGPLLIAMVTERIFEDPAMVGWSIAIVCAPAFLASSICYAIAWRNVGRSLKRDDEVAAHLKEIGQPAGA